MLVHTGVICPVFHLLVYVVTSQTEVEAGGVTASQKQQLTGVKI